MYAISLHCSYMNDQYRAFLNIPPQYSARYLLFYAKANIFQHITTDDTQHENQTQNFVTTNQRCTIRPPHRLLTAVSSKSRLL